MVIISSTQIINKTEFSNPSDTGWDKFNAGLLEAIKNGGNSLVAFTQCAWSFQQAIDLSTPENFQYKLDLAKLLDDADIPGADLSADYKKLVSDQKPTLSEQQLKTMFSHIFDYIRNAFENPGISRDFAKGLEAALSAMQYIDQSFGEKLDSELIKTKFFHYAEAFVEVGAPTQSDVAHAAQQIVDYLS